MERIRIHIIHGSVGPDTGKLRLTSITDLDDKRWDLEFLASDLTDDRKADILIRITEQGYKQLRNILDNIDGRIKGSEESKRIAAYSVKGYPGTLRFNPSVDTGGYWSISIVASNPHDSRVNDIKLTLAETGYDALKHIVEDVEAQLQRMLKPENLLRLVTLIRKGVSSLLYKRSVIDFQ